MPGLPEADRTAPPGRGRRGWPLSSDIQGCFSGALRTWWTSFLVKMDVIASPFGRGVTAGDGEGKLGVKELPYSDKQTLCQRDVIAVSVLFASGLALSGASRQGRVAAPSVCLAVAHILLAAAPTAPPCFRHWRRSSLLPPKGEPYPLYLLCARPSLPSMMSFAAAAMSGQRSARALASSGGNLPSTQSAKS